MFGFFVHNYFKSPPLSHWPFSIYEKNIFKITEKFKKNVLKRVFYKKNDNYKRLLRFTTTFQRDPDSTIAIVHS